MSRSLPPFEAPTQGSHNKKVDEIFEQQPQLQQSTNVALLSRGISLLSITQLRDLLRDYSLPTGGNKNVLVNRLIIFLETFGQNQQNILTAFSAKLKKLLSIDAEDPSSSPHSEESSPIQHPQIAQNLPEDILSKLFTQTPSELYESTDIQPSLGPLIVQPDSLNQPYQFTLTSPDKFCIPVLQFSPSFSTVLVSRIVVQLNGTFINLKGPSFYSDLKDLIGHPCTLQIVSIEPATSIIGVVRWMRPIPIQHMINQIALKEPVRKICCNQPPNGICPLTHKIITRPARGVNCMHGECFDVSGFICNSMRNNSWQCPICRKPLTIEDLRIDPYYFALASGSLT